MGFAVSKCMCSDVGTEKDSETERSEKKGKFLFSPHKKSSPVMSKVERALKAALLIQRWYRRYCARLEIRRRYTWTIFQSIEYAGEQDQMKLYNFFNALLTHMGTGSINEVMEALSPRASPTAEDDERRRSAKTLLEEAWNEDVPVESSYKGPHLSNPLTTQSIHQMVEAFKKKKYILNYILESLSSVKGQVKPQSVDIERKEKNAKNEAMKINTELRH
ncbi:serine/threonine-protein phosphatase with EF-hands pef-1-like [Macrobrachium rosenbergii]|uniref:serine/threonine-protein phosphatase with EF-hands pef-1-like n=1 Tax=Macrobrachium rosenbergii TaxID=79674 RepID=UPI0034D6E0DC